MAKALELFVSSDAVEGLIVDDVLTTGGSMVDHRAALGGSRCKGVVIFARGECPSWVVPLFQMPRGLWV